MVMTLTMNGNFPLLVGMKVLTGLAFSLPLLAADPRVDFAMGVRAEERGDEAAAQTAFEAAWKQDPKALPLVRKLAEYRLAANDRAGAVKLYRDLAQGSPERTDVQLAYATILEQTGHGDAMAQKLAVEILEKTLEKNPGDLTLISRLLTIFRSQGEKDRAIALMEQLPQSHPQAAEIYASAARGLFKGDDIVARDRVDRRYLAALQSHPEDQVLARFASDYFRTTGRLEEAIQILADHVKAAPWSLDLRTRLGVLLFSAKRDAEGEAALKEVVDIRPNSDLALQSLAKFHRLKGNEKEARHYGAELLKARGGSPKEFVILADEYLAAGDPRAARLLLEKGVFDHPTRPELAMKLAVATRLDPETKAKAGRLFREAEAAMGEMKPDAAFLMESADCLLEEGQSKAAEERMRTAIRSFPPDQKKETASALRRLAGLWDQENRNADAAKALKQRADALDPP
jgi:tetratricopeptide (TPR) repeat protein